MLSHVKVANYYYKCIYWILSTYWTSISCTADIKTQTNDRPYTRRKDRFSQKQILLIYTNFFQFFSPLNQLEGTAIHFLSTIAWFDHCFRFRELFLVLNIGMTDTRAKIYIETISLFQNNNTHILKKGWIVAYLSYLNSKTTTASRQLLLWIILLLLWLLLL